MSGSARNLISRRERVLGVGAPLFYDDPVHIVRGDGVFLFDADGRRYLDMYNNVPCVGHANPHVVEAMQRQASTLNVHSRYLHEGVLDYAERLVSKHDSSLGRMVFTCTGTEANEVAIAMARLATGGRGIICTDRAYHGNSALVSKLTWAGGRSDPEIRSVRFPQTYRPIEEGLSEPELADRYLADVAAAIESFAASPLQAAAGAAVLDVIETENLQQQVAEVGTYLRDGLDKIDCPAMGDVRGDGLFTGIDWVSDRQTKTPDPEGAERVVNRLKDKGILTGTAGALFNVVKLRPPLVFGHEHADLFLTAFEEAVGELD